MLSYLFSRKPAEGAAPKAKIDYALSLKKAQRLDYMLTPADKITLGASGISAAEHALTEKFGVMAWFEKLVTAASLKESFNGKPEWSSYMYMDQLFGNDDGNGYAALKENLVTLDQVFRMPDASYLDHLFSDTGMFMLRHQHITAEDVVKMKDLQDVRDYFKQATNAYHEQIKQEKETAAQPSTARMKP